MLHESTRTLIVRLHEMTAAGQLDWREGERGAAVFETEGYLVEVEAEPPTLRVLTVEGRELERAGSNELAAEPWPDGNGTFATHVAEMGSRAHRVARGAERAIATILSALSAPPAAKPVPKPEPKPEPAPQPAAAEAVAEVASRAEAQEAREAAMAPPQPHAVLPNVDRPPPPAPATATPPATPPAAPVVERQMFGGISGFARPAPPQAPHPQQPAAPPRPKPYGLSMTGISATTRQSSRGDDLAADKPAGRPATAGVYKPWNS